MFLLKMKKVKNILNFFQVQTTSISCPACGISLQKSKLNVHLDSNCSISVGTFPKPNSIPSSDKFTSKIGRDTIGTTNKPHLFTSKTNSSRLSLKNQRKKSNLQTNSTSKVNSIKEIEIITLEDDAPSLELTDSKVCTETNTLSMSVSVAEANRSDSFALTVSQKSFHISKLAVKEHITNIKEDDKPSAICVHKASVVVNDDSKKDFNEIDDSKKDFNEIEDSKKDFNEIGDSKKDFNEIEKPQSLSVNGFSSIKSENNLSSIDNSDIVALLNDVDKSLEAGDAFVEATEELQNYAPYYIVNFKHILNSVLQEEYNKILFNGEDMTFVDAFQNSSDPAQKLYVRLFQRKYQWLRLSKINYPNITKDPSVFLDELVQNGLVDSGLEKISLDTALDLLSLPDAKNVAKQFNFNSSGKNKADITQMLLKHCKEHKSVFFTNGRNGVSSTMLKKVKQILGPCYRLSLLPKRLFTRILMLFSLSTMSEDDDDAAGGQQQQLLTLLQVNKGELTFPEYKINRQTMIFIDRDELIRYEEAKQLENDIMNAVESRNFDLAKQLYIDAKEEFEDQLFYPFVERSASLPNFLKKFTSFHIYVRCMTQGVEILQRLRQYKEAVELLKRLLDQEVFCQDYRGRWWDRMALNLEQHLKQRQQALEAIKEGMCDKNVRVGYRYSLLIRALRILKTADETDELKNEILEAASIIEAPKVVIKGRLCPRSILGRRNVFISSSSALENEDDITVLGVEQLAIEHYQSEGYTEGIHGEGSTFHSLYGLLFWDIIYDGDIPDAFISPYQHHPLDLNHESFFVRREKEIMAHLEKLKSSTVEEIKEIMKSTWGSHFGQCSLVSWDRFTDVEHILGLVGCFDNNVLCGICERLARDFRFTRSGVPDLVVWNPETLQVKIVEVKGPGDKLSSKQILWLDFLLKLGAPAEVCHIEAVGSKRLRKE